MNSRKESAKHKRSEIIKRKKGSKGFVNDNKRERRKERALYSQ